MTKAFAAKQATAATSAAIIVESFMPLALVSQWCVCSTRVPCFTRSGGCTLTTSSASGNLEGEIGGFHSYSWRYDPGKYTMLPLPQSAFFLRYSYEYSYFAQLRHGAWRGCHLVLVGAPRLLRPQVMPMDSSSWIRLVYGSAVLITANAARAYRC